ncbi:acyltransferase family protein [Mycolicibacterium iranicum]|uniref:Acyltransferase n=1 Tax=Mycolicibacterium iranicum TaxID=912594 RepID=A0A178LU25_MYCIR|nr:acyltransferase [Mycolicibacterium iranicum]OAN37602.1 acyltransferase [Mycolicibacterium iranicum]
MSANPDVAGEDGGVGRWTNSLGRARRTLADEFDPRRNALNAWRLALATGVVLWHSWLITGRQISFEPAHQLLRDVWVDGFFAISGFLITSSWFNRPRLWEYFVARGLRLLPAFWVCLVVVAFVIAPVAVGIQGGSPGRLLSSSGPIDYVLQNSALMVKLNNIDGTPLGVPRPGEWNSSLWTLYWEALCYLAIAILGVLGLLRRRWVIPVLLVVAVIWSMRVPSMSAIVEAPPGKGPPIDAATQVLIAQEAAARFALMFLAGALLYQLREAIPARWSLVALSVAIVLAASALPNYRVVAAFALAYALIVSGALIRHPRLRLRTDLSYGVYIYAFPMQQLLIICGLAFLAPPVFALIATAVTLPLAAMSWFLVEKPAMALKRRLGRSAARDG